MLKREFTVADEYAYNRTGPVIWIASHLLRYKRLVLGYIAVCLLTNVLMSGIPALTGFAFTAVLQGDQRGLLLVALEMLGVTFIGGCCDLVSRMLPEIVGKRVTRDSREELYVSLLGKSQTFHNRQRVGDIMARAANDMTQLSSMIVPGFDIIFDSFSSLVIALVFIGILNWQLLLVPLLFTAAFLIALRYYSRKLNPVSDSMREQF
ncbi:MAG TPA: ABC transporter transmembrane domain-containing protein, partial [Ktedonobacteraceae bacterium]|nr:ABC transporter transmembrane domain-containing protein [Ktedonobacteraceae bacterium]